jgi:GntR family transcriptional regulator
VPPDLDWTQAVNTRDPTPLHAQLERTIRVAIASGWLRAGDQLPTVRQLAVALRINANTVARVYAQLERDRILETRRGVGSFIAARAAESPLNDDARRAELRAIVTRALAEASARGFSAADVRREMQSIVKGAS